MTDRYDRRLFIARGAKTALGAAVVGGGASTLLGACGGSSSSSSTSISTNPNVGISTATPKSGGSIIVGTYSDITSFDPSNGRFDATGICYANAVYDPLAIVGQDGNVYPYLAQSITPNATYTQWTIALRPNVNFHDGTPCDADAVIFNINRLISAALTGLALKPVTSVTKIDNLTLAINLNQPWVPFVANLTGQAGYIASPKALASSTSDTVPVGTGPFMYKQWVENDHFSLTKNPNYWRPGLPYLDSLEFRPILDDQSREATLRSGGINLMHSQDPQNYTDLFGNASFQVFNDVNAQVGEPSIDMQIVNCGKPPLDDLRVRQALAYCIDKDSIRKIFFDGLPKLAYGPFMPGDPWYVDNTSYPTFNTAQAKSLIASYTAEKGPLRQLQLSGPSTGRYGQIMQALQGMYSEAGISTTIAQTDQATYIDDVVLGSYDVGLFQIGNAVDPDENYIYWSTTTLGPEGGISLNIPRNNDPALEALLLTGRSNPDPQARITAYQQAGLKLANDLAFLYGWQTLWIAAADDTTQNFRGMTTPDGKQAYGFNAGAMFFTETWTTT